MSNKIYIRNETKLPPVCEGVSSYPPKVFGSPAFG